MYYIYLPRLCVNCMNQKTQTCIIITFLILCIVCVVRFWLFLFDQKWNKPHAVSLLSRDADDDVMFYLPTYTANFSDTPAVIHQSYTIKKNKTKNKDATGFNVTPSQGQTSRKLISEQFLHPPFVSTLPAKQTRGTGVHYRNIVFIFPYRDRIQHFKKQTQHLRRITRPDWNVTVFVIHQGDNDSFRRAWLLNIGIYEAMQLFPDDTCVVTHDIDMLASKEVDYGWCEKPTQPCSELKCHGNSVPYNSYSGGVIQASLSHWKKINGYTNEAYGWGGEDDDLFHRFRLNNFISGSSVRRPAKGNGKCDCLHDKDHTKRARHPTMYNHIVKKIQRMSRGSTEWKTDGLNSVSYSVEQKNIDSWGNIWLRVTSKKRKSDNTNHTKHRKVVYHKMNGRLGNQLFQMASILGIAAKHDATVCLSGNEMEKYFEGSPPSCTLRSNEYKKISEHRQYAKYHEFEFSTDVEISGYLQSYRYFPDGVRSKLKFKQHILDMAQKVVAKFASKTLVGIHMRRYELDYLRIPPNQYFINAKLMFMGKYPNVHFIVTCDDKSWCTNQPFLAQENVHIVTENFEAPLDMAILASCRHIILSAGTFGWWAAFLGPDIKNGIVVYYDSEFVMQHPTNKDNVEISDFYPQNWIPMSSESKTSLLPIQTHQEHSLDLFFKTSEADWCPQKNSDAAAFISHLYKTTAAQKSTRCKREKRFGSLGDGGKIVCLDTMHEKECVVYSLGSRLDFTFEQDILRQLNCRVYTFDCTVTNDYKLRIPQGIMFFPWCIGGRDSVQTISSDFGRTGDTGQYYTLATVMEKLQHSHIDLLKMDIERHEFDVIHSLNSKNIIRQIVFETHIHNAYGVWGRAVKHVEWDELWKQIHSLGYFVFSHETNPLCLCCCEFSVIKQTGMSLKDT